jgi:hypothetical protein
MQEVKLTETDQRVGEKLAVEQGKWYTLKSCAWESVAAGARGAQ